MDYGQYLSPVVAGNRLAMVDLKEIAHLYINLPKST
jgi:hypothetical protein